MGSSNKTKDWLKNQLVSHGVPLPSSTAKKEEYQRLYEEQVLPRQNNTEFSSDDDAEEPSPQDSPVRSSSVANSRPDTKTQNGTDGSTDKHTAWVERLSDKNLFTALKANGKDIGGIVGSTRILYQNMLIDLLKKDEQQTLSEIDAYLSQNDDARTLWAEAGVLNGVTNGASTNGNGYSDSDDDETVETASRASRSSRASSKRMTPIRSSASTPPPKESTPTHRTVADSHVKPRRATASVVRDEMLGGINEVDDDDRAVTPSSSRSPLMSDSLLYNRVSSPSDTSLRFSKPYTVRKTVHETAEISRTHRVYDDDNEDEVINQRHRSAPPKTVRKIGARDLLYYFLIFVVVVGVPLLALYIYALYENSEKCTGPECSTDELDILLQEMEQDPDPGVTTGA